MYRPSGAEQRVSSTRRSTSPREEPLPPVVVGMPTPDGPTTPLVPNTAASDAATATILIPSDTQSPTNHNSTQLDTSTLGQVGNDGGLAKLDTQWLNTMVDWDTSFQPGQSGLGSAEALPPDFWTSMDWDSHANQNETNGQFPTPPSQPTPDYSRGTGGGDSGLSHDRNAASDNTPPECLVMELSQLVARLQSQYRISCDLVEKGGALPDIGGVSRSSSSPKTGALFDDRAFRSMASWLLQTPTLPDLDGGPAQRDSPPSLGDMLSGAFTGSHQLLDIVRVLTKVEPDAMPPPTLTAASAALHGQTATTPGYAGGYATTITRHLVLACHNLLLSAYALLLAALQHDAQLPPGAAGDKAAALAELRLVSIVQVCAYLIRRQEQAVVAYVEDPPQPPPLPENVPAVPASSDTAGGDRQATGNNPMMEVQERLAQLRKTLQLA